MSAVRRGGGEGGRRGGGRGGGEGRERGEGERGGRERGEGRKWRGKEGRGKEGNVQRKRGPILNYVHSFQLRDLLSFLLPLQHHPKHHRDPLPLHH